MYPLQITSTITIIIITIIVLCTGIGYFTLSLLVHTEVQCVHSCDWNESALEGLRRGLVANHINNERCVIHCGDNRKVSKNVEFTIM